MERKITDWGGSIVAFFAVILVNYLSNAIPIGGVTQKDISDKYSSLFTPDAFTFAIWGVIYAFLTAFVIYQALPTQRNNALVASVSKLFIISCVANIAWLFSWHYELLPLSLLIMFGILLSLIAIYRTLGNAGSPATLGQRLFLYLPFSLYVAWISVATVANISILQAAYDWNAVGLSAVNWTLLKLGLVTAISVLVVMMRHDMAYGLVIAWAAFGIMSKQADTPAIAGSATVVMITMILLVTFVGVRWLLRER